MKGFKKKKKKNLIWNEELIKFMERICFSYKFLISVNFIVIN